MRGGSPGEHETLASIIAGGQFANVNRDSFAEQTRAAIEGRLADPVARARRAGLPRWHRVRHEDPIGRCFQGSVIGVLEPPIPSAQRLARDVNRGTVTGDIRILVLPGSEDRAARRLEVREPPRQGVGISVGAGWRSG